MVIQSAVLKLHHSSNEKGCVSVCKPRGVFMGYRLSILQCCYWMLLDVTLKQEEILTRMIRQAGPMKLQMKLFSVLSQHLNKILII